MTGKALPDGPFCPTLAQSPQTRGHLLSSPAFNATLKTSSEAFLPDPLVTRMGPTLGEGMSRAQLPLQILKWKKIPFFAIPYGQLMWYFVFKTTTK